MSLVVSLHSYSKQKYLLDSSMVPSLPDGTPSYKSFMDSKNQRFWTPEQSNKNRILCSRVFLSFLFLVAMCVALSASLPRLSDISHTVTSLL